ncbi:tape measure protein [Bacillaceae bacterium Marseille-Q3522]|nr:tape measure protein [Bacillaceae bacterium Marseille-Q3522]
MPSLEQSIKLNDGFTSVLNKINAGMQATLGMFQHFQGAIESEISANASVQSVNQLEDSITKTTVAQQKLNEAALQNDIGQVSQAAAIEMERVNQSLREGTIEANKLQSTLESGVSTGSAVQAVHQLEGSINQATEAQQRLNNTVTQNKLEQAAQSAAGEVEKVNQSLRAGTMEASRLQNMLNIDNITATVGTAWKLNNALTKSNEQLTAMGIKANQADAAAKKLPFSIQRMIGNLAIAGRLWMNNNVNQARAVQLANRLGSSLSKSSLAQSKLGQSTTRFVKAIGRSNLVQNKLVRGAGRLLTTFIKIPISAGKLPILLTKAGIMLGRNITKQMRMRNEVDKTSRAQMRFNKAVSLLQFGAALAALTMIQQKLTSMIEQADTFVQTMARLNMINDGSQTTEQLSDKVLAAAQRSRSAYKDTADFVARLGINAGDAFASNDETIAFAELLNKAYKIGGASVAEQQGSMLQLTQALASGALRGEELNSVLEGAPLVVKAITKEMGISMAELRDVASEGGITADIIKRAMFNAADDINSKFTSIPMTWADMWTSAKNIALKAFQPLIERFSAFLNSPQGQQFFQSITTGIVMLAQVASWAFDVIVSGISWIQQNANLVQLAFVTLSMIIIYAAIGAAIAWAIVNWQLLLIIIIIATVINFMDKMGVKAGEIAARMAGMVAFVATVFYDVILFVIGLFTTFIQVINNIFIFFWNIVAGVAEFFVNVWNHPVYATQMLFYNLVRNILNFFASIADGAGKVGVAIGNAFISGANTAIKAVNWIIDALNMIPGVNLGKVDQFKEFSSAGQTGDSIRGLAEKFNPGPAPENYWSAPQAQMTTVDGLASAISGLKNPVKSFNTAADAISNLGFNAKGLLDNINNMIGSDQTMANALNNFGNSGVGDALGKGKDIGDVGTVDKIKDDVSITEDDLKLMRDIAEREYILRYQQLSPSATVNFTSTGNSEEDAKRLLAMMEQMIQEQVASQLV